MALFPSPTQNSSGTSFSPKPSGGSLMPSKSPVSSSQPTRLKKRRTAKKKNSVNIFIGVAFIVLLAAGILTALVFTYGQAKKARVNDLEEQLESNEGQFETSFLEEIKELDLRLSTAYSIVRDHRVVSTVLPLVSKLTIPSVQYDSFDFMFASGEDPTKVEMSGVARNYRAIAQQSQVFEKEPKIRDFIFAEFQLQENGDVSFSLTLIFQPEIMSYALISSEIQPTLVSEIQPSKAVIPVVGEVFVKPAIVPITKP